MNPTHLKHWSLSFIISGILFFTIGQSYADGVKAKGSDHAAITIIAYSDSQCQSCVKVDKALDEVMKAYPDDIQVVRKSYSDEIKEAKGYGVTTAPTFFINGRKLVGARSVADFKRIIDEELGLTKPVQLSPQGTLPLTLPSPQGRGMDGIEKVSIDTKDAPSFGPQEAPVLIVEFSDFQCPFCARAVPTLQDLKKKYPTQIRVAFKHFPLDFHADAPLAHSASLAARDQGKFWEMHDWIFTHQQTMKREHLIQYAKELGLNVETFTADMDSGKYKTQIEQNVAEGKRLGVSGTPTFFVNGQKLVGAQPMSAFVSIIEGQIGKE